jgi:hypothetical protein
MIKSDLECELTEKIIIKVQDQMKFQLETLKKKGLTDKQIEIAMSPTHNTYNQLQMEVSRYLLSKSGLREIN